LRFSGGQGDRVAVVRDLERVATTASAEPIPAEGSGLIGLKDRIEALGGRIRIDSAPGSGTRIDVEIPALQPLQLRSDSNERSA